MTAASNGTHILFRCFFIDLPFLDEFDDKIDDFKQNDESCNEEQYQKREAAEIVADIERGCGKEESKPKHSAKPNDRGE